jgi:hypothetical protein
VATQPEIVREFFNVIAAHPDHGAGPLLQADRAVLWAASILTHVLAIVTLVPLYFLLRRTCSPEASWRAVAFWPAVPALAVFLPASDTLLPCFGITFLLFWLKGWDRRSAVLCALSGIVLWTGLFVTLAMLPSAALAVAMTVWEGWICDRGQRSSAPGASLLRALIWFGLGISLPTVLLWAWAGIRLPVIWFWNLSNHAEFYRLVPRTYWKWLLVNPIELAVAAGLPLTMLAAAAYSRAGKNWRNKAAGPLWCCALVWGCLWLSGKNSGEVARLWIVLMPWLIWVAAAGIARQQEESANGSRWSSAICWVPLALQLLLGILLASAVTPSAVTTGWSDEQGTGLGQNDFPRVALCRGSGLALTISAHIRPLKVAPSSIGSSGSRCEVVILSAAKDLRCPQSRPDSSLCSE